MFLMKSYSMLQNSRVIAFTVSELLRENQQDGGRGGWGGVKLSLPPPPPPPRLGLKALFVHKIVFLFFDFFRHIEKTTI